MLMTEALALLAALADERSQVATTIGLVVFGLGFGMVTQILVVAVQNGVERRELGVATATAGFFRALGGALGAAVLGAVFAASAGSPSSAAGPQGLGAAAQADVIAGVQNVFWVAAPIAALARVVVLRLPEAKLRTGAEPKQADREREPAGAGAER